MDSDNMERFKTFAKMETGIDSLQFHIGTGKRGDIPFFWTIAESSLFGRTVRITSTFNMKNIDTSLNICRDTIKFDKLSGDSIMIMFEVIYHLSTDEIQYIWLDGNNNRSEKTVLISLDFPLKEGKKFPDLTVEQLNGEKLSFDDFIGKTIVINWWQTACAPCIAEMPGFNKLVEQYKRNPNVVFIAIADNNKEQVIRFLENREFNYIQTLGNEDILKIFGDSYPKNVIIDSTGKICHYSKAGYPDKYLEIEKVLKTLLE